MYVEKLLSNKLSKQKLQLIKTVGQEAKNLNLNAYVVGGVPRDLFLGKKLDKVNFDIVIEPPLNLPLNKGEKKWGYHLTLEKGGIKGGYVLYPLINRLRKKIKIKNCIYYRQFPTATVDFGDFQIDFALARSEKYPKPGALPEVKPANIFSDLYRRDFTINSIAISLLPETFGHLLDPTGGLEDLNRKYIRVIHKKSFIDDPTRILRALRFAARLNFSLEPITEKLLRAAIKNNYIKNVSQERLTDELLLTLKEVNTAKCLKEFSKFGIKFFDDVNLNKNFRLLNSRLTTKFPIETKLAVLLYTFNRLSPEETKLKLKALKLPRRIVNEIYNVFRFISGRTIKSLPEWSDYFFKIVKFNRKKILVSGKDLIRLGFKPGPLFKEIIQSVNLNKNLKTRREIEKFILEHWPKKC